MSWFNLEPIAEDAKISPQTDLHCPKCMPTCNFVKYRLESSTANFNATLFAGRQILDPEFMYASFGLFKFNYTNILKDYFDI